MSGKFVLQQRTRDALLETIRRALGHNKPCIEEFLPTMLMAEPIVRAIAADIDCAISKPGYDPVYDHSVVRNATYNVMFALPYLIDHEIIPEMCGSQLTDEQLANQFVNWSYLHVAAEWWSLDRTADNVAQRWIQTLKPVYRKPRSYAEALHAAFNPQ